MKKGTVIAIIAVIAIIIWSQANNKPKQVTYQVPVNNYVNSNSNTISFKGSGDKAYYTKQANYYRSMGDSYARDAKNYLDWAQSYFKEGNTSMGNSYMSSSSRFQSQANSYYKTAQEMQEKADAAAN